MRTTPPKRERLDAVARKTTSEKGGHRISQGGHESIGRADPCPLFAFVVFEDDCETGYPIEPGKRGRGQAGRAVSWLVAVGCKADLQGRSLACPRLRTSRSGDGRRPGWMEAELDRKRPKMGQAGTY